ncbi:hypothetical protein [Rhodopila sp.]|uniref:hypothetical protein n=1 Tax=Rhodopila sp. TaxID=2480087 RepID=UPI003D0997F8
MEAFSLIHERLRAIEDRLLKIESGQNSLISDAKAAAGAAATMVATAALTETVTRLTRIEEDLKRSDRPRLTDR